MLCRSYALQIASPSPQADYLNLWMSQFPTMEKKNEHNNNIFLKRC